MDRRPLAGEVGQEHQSLGAGRRLAGFGGKQRSGGRRVEVAGELLANQWLSVPLVARPDIEACWCGKSQGAYQRRGSRTRLAVIMMMKMVEPYMIIMSPASSTPTESASAAASAVPAMTGVPAASPVSSAARGVTAPTMSVVQARSGRRSGSMMSGASSPLQARSSTT